MPSNLDDPTRWEVVAIVIITVLCGGILFADIADDLTVRNFQV